MLLQTLSLKHAHSHTIRNNNLVELTASALKQRTRKNALLLDSSFVVAGNLERSFSQHCKIQHCHTSLCRHDYHYTVVSCSAQMPNLVCCTYWLQVHARQIIMQLASSSHASVPKWVCYYYPYSCIRFG